MGGEKEALLVNRRRDRGVFVFKRFAARVQ